MRGSPGIREQSLERARLALARMQPLDDPLLPTVLLRSGGVAPHPDRDRELLAAWAARHRNDAPDGGRRYRWAISPTEVAAFPPWIGPRKSWRPWRPRDADEWQQNDRLSIERYTAPATLSLYYRLMLPIILTETMDWLAGVIRRDGPDAVRARALLADAMPALRRDAARWAVGFDAWGDTFALWCLARHPGALRRLHPFAVAIADSYADAAQLGGMVTGKRFPFAGTPLVSASAQLARGLMALGLGPRVVGVLARLVEHAEDPTGGWGDAGGPVDPLTTLVSADLLAGLDPSFDPERTMDTLARLQRPDGTWRALGPETAWLTVEIAALIERLGRPFPWRFQWPHLALEHRDRRTGLPFLSYLQEAATLFAELPQLGALPIEMAFLDIAGFGEWNNRLGMDRGDALLRRLADSLAGIPGVLAVRDGGDEFLVVGRPGATGLANLMTRFRQVWAEALRTGPGPTLPAPLRVVGMAGCAADLIAMRDELGRAIGQLKAEHPMPPPPGVERWLR